MSDDSSPSTIWVEVIAGVVGTVLGATVTSLGNYMTNQRQVDVKMDEIGIGILRAPPKDDIVVMRSWAIDVIEQSSGRKFNDEQRAVLLKQELVLRWDPMSSRAAEEAIKKINE